MAAAANIQQFQSQFFVFTITGITPGIFKTVQMPMATIDIVEEFTTDPKGRPTMQRSIGDDQHRGFLTVTGPVTADKSLETWIEAVATTGIDANKKPGTLTFNDVTGAPQAAYTLTDCVITSLGYSPLMTGAGQQMDFSAMLHVNEIKRTQ